MRNWTDRQFADAGWGWVLRCEKSGRPLGCTVCAADVGVWLDRGEGAVINLHHIKNEGQGDG